MKRKLIIACICSLLLLSYAYADDNSPFSGGVFLGGRALNLSHQSANFNQYNEIAPGLFGGGDVKYDKDRYYFSADGAYLGEDDFYVKLKGGRWGDFKYSLYFTEFPHNFSFGDRTVFTSPGSQTQVLVPGATTTTLRNLSTWPSTSFDYKYTRKDVGGAFDLTMIRPFFFNVDANQLKRQGQVTWGADSPGSVGNTTELALPIDDTTSNINATLGWKSKQFYAALSGGYSKFNNSAEYTRFQDPFGGTPSLNTIAGAPDNNSMYLKFTGTAKLPLASTFALTGSYQDNRSSTSLLNTLGNIPGVRTSQNNFRGDVEYWNIGANLTSNPWKNLTTKLYFKYIDRKNKSDTIDFFDAAGNFLTSNELFDYQRTTFGAEASYRFTKSLKGILGYEFNDLQRRAKESELGEASEDPSSPEMRIPDTWENKINAQLVWNPLDWLGTRLKYQKLYRGATVKMATGVNPTSSADANDVLNNYKQDFYAARKTQDMVKATFDLTPLPNLDVTLEYAFKHDSYDGQVLGYYKAQQHEFIIDGSYEWKGLKFFGFFDYDTSWTDQQTRQSNVTVPFNADPRAGLVGPGNSFNWRASLRNDNYAYGAGSSVPIIKNKLSFIVQYDFQKNNGTADFTSQFLSTNANAPIARNPDLLNINPWDDYTMQSISARFLYNVTKQLGLSFGYIYRQFKYNDGQIPGVDPNQTSTVINGYRYVMPATGNVNTLLTGAYTDQNYNANIFFLKAMYRF